MTKQQKITVQVTEECYRNMICDLAATHPEIFTSENMSMLYGDDEEKWTFEGIENFCDEFVLGTEPEIWHINIEKMKREFKEEIDLIRKISKTKRKQNEILKNIQKERTKKTIQK